MMLINWNSLLLINGCSSSKILLTRRERRVSQSKFFERVWENIPLNPPYKGGLRGMFSQFPRCSP